VLRTEIVLAEVGEALRAELAPLGALKERPGVTVIEVEGDARVGDTLRVALAGGAKVVEVVPRRETLEDLFMRRAL
jgi:ABC-2 type transport system ATP-binding protein